jgi:hypothetical protein
MRILRLYAILFRMMGRALGVTMVQALLLFVVLIATLQAAVFMALEGWTFLDGFYFAIVTMATVGYGDFVPVTVPGKLAAIFFMVLGIGVFVLAISTLAQAFLREIFIAEHDGGPRPPGGGRSGEPLHARGYRISVQDREVRRDTTD